MLLGEFDLGVRRVRAHLFPPGKDDERHKGIANKRHFPRAEHAAQTRNEARPRGGRYKFHGILAFLTWRAYMRPEDPLAFGKRIMSRALARSNIHEMIDGEFADLELLQAPKPQIIDVKVRAPSLVQRMTEHNAFWFLFVFVPGMLLSIAAMGACMIAAPLLFPSLDSLTAALIGYAVSVIPALLIGKVMGDILAAIVKRRQGLRLRPVSRP